MEVSANHVGISVLVTVPPLFSRKQKKNLVLPLGRMDSLIPAS
jgi:hypothetical protein